MARQRRGGGGGDLVKGTLGTLIRTTLQQAGVVRDAIGSRLDEMRDGRRRSDLLAELGEVVLGLIRDGEIDIEELPEARELVETIEAMDSEDAAPPRSLRRRSGDRKPPPDMDDFHDLHDPSRDVALPSSRARFDQRPSSDSGPPLSRARTPSGDGTVSSSTWSPPSRRPSGPTRVWRPPSDSSPPPHTAESGPVEPPPPAARRGGISFDDGDEDLSEYMHPDDVPPKKP